MKTNHYVRAGIRGSRALTALAAAGMVAAFGLDASADTNVVRNGVNWDATYEADFEPHSASTNPIWVESIAGAGSSRVASGGILRLTSDGIGGYLRYDQTGSTWTGLGAQRTIEWRMMVESQTSGDRATDFLSFAGDDGYWIVEFKDASLRLVGSSAGSDILIDTTTFHTYRLVIDSNLAVDQAVLYVDGLEFLSSGAATPGNAGANDFLAFGDGSSGGIGGAIQWDFVSWTAGAFPAAAFEVSFDTITVAAAAAMEFTSVLGAVYQLQSTMSIVPPTNWVETGATITGNGDALLLFDPTGFATQKTYRVLANPM